MIQDRNFNHCRLFLQVPVHLPVTSTHHQKMLRYLRDLFSTKGVPAVVMTDNGPPFNGEDSDASRENLTSSTRRPHSTSISWMDHQATVKKVKAAYKKTDGSQMLKREHYCSYATPRLLKTYHHQRRFTWKACPRSCHALMSQTCQHPENPPTTTRNSTDAERTLRPSHRAKEREF